MLQFKKILTESDLNDKLSREQFVDFLFKHLDRFGDPKPAIEKSVDYAFSQSEGMGGFCIAAFYDDNLVGALVCNKINTAGYIPENILVYVAVDSSYRNKGFGKQIVEKCFEWADGDVKLHVEYDNPAKRLYERVGMTNNYAEMRYIKEK
jgi:GNAT superfamily N-acetyltransferase